MLLGWVISWRLCKVIIKFTKIRGKVMGCETCNLTFLRGISTQLFSLVTRPLGTLGVGVPTWLAFASRLVFHGSAICVSFPRC